MEDIEVRLAKVKNRLESSDVKFHRQFACIIVGRCSDYLFRNNKNTLNIFIYASYDKKLENCVNLLNMTKENAKRSIEEVDRARLRYHLHYTGYAPSDYKYKDLMVDSGVLGVDGTARLLADYVKAKFGV